MDELKIISSASIRKCELSYLKEKIDTKLEYQKIMKHEEDRVITFKIRRYKENEFIVERPRVTIVGCQ